MEKNDWQGWKEWLELTMQIASMMAGKPNIKDTIRPDKGWTILFDDGRKLDAIRVGVEDAKRECGMKTKEIEMEWAVDDDDDEEAKND